MQPLISAARRTSGLSQSEVARRAGTSRPTLSSYEHGHRSPTLETLIRLLAANGQQLEAIPMLTFTEHHDSRGKPFFVPDHLPRLSLRDAFATVVLPTHVDWSASSAPRALADELLDEAAMRIPMHTAREWLSHYRGCVGTEIYEHAAQRGE